MPGIIWNPGDCGPEDERECTEECASHEGGDCDCQTDDEPDFDVGGDDDF